MRAEWDIPTCLRNGKLVQVLPQHHTPDADIYAVYSHANQASTRVRAVVDFMTTALGQRNQAIGTEGGGASGEDGLDLPPTL